MTVQKWLLLVVNGPLQAQLALTSGKYGILRFPLVKLTIPVADDLTFFFKIDAMRCNICYQLTSCREPSLGIAFVSAPEMFCFLHSGVQGWHFVVHYLVSSSKFRDVWGPSLIMHLASPSRGRFWLKFAKSSSSLGKRTIRASCTRIKLHMEGFKLALCDTLVARQIIAGNSISLT